MAIDLGKDRSYCKTGQWILFGGRSWVGEAKNTPRNYSHCVENKRFFEGFSKASLVRALQVRITSLVPLAMTPSTASTTTLSAADVINGGAGIDMLNVAVTAGTAIGLKGNGAAALGNVTGSQVAAATAANIGVDGGTGTASAAVAINDGVGLTSATITGKNGSQLPPLLSRIDFSCRVVYMFGSDEFQVGDAA